jgi:hypothetical protein
MIIYKSMILTLIYRDPSIEFFRTLGKVFYAQSKS